MAEHNTPWYPVPGYGGNDPLTRDPHVVNRDGELVATFETLEDAELCAEAVNGSHTAHVEAMERKTLGLLSEERSHV